MSGIHKLLPSLLFLAPIKASALPSPIRFSRQVLPVLQSQCYVCHNSPAPPGGFSMGSQQSLFAGGRHGPAIVPGKSGQSALIQYVTGASQPQMPPAQPLSLETIALLRRWIDEGAKVDSMTAAPAPPTAGSRPSAPGPHRSNALTPRRPNVLAQPGSRDLPAPVAQAAPVTALAYSPDGHLLAAGGYRAVRLLDPATGTVVRTLGGPSGQVLSVAWSSDGRWLAAAGGVPAMFGAVCLWNTATWARPRVLHAHDDAITAIAWRPNSLEFATASMDKTVKVWNAAAGAVLRTLKDHADPVFCVAYSPDGKWMASGSADRSAKLYATAGYSRVAAISAHGDTVTALAFSPKSDLLVTACADHRVRVWSVKPDADFSNPLRDRGSDEAVNAISFSAHGSLFACGSADRHVRLFDGEAKDQKRDLKDAADWVDSVAASPDAGTVAAGAADGKVYFWSVSDGKLLRAELLGGPVLTAGTP